MIGVQEEDRIHVEGFLRQREFQPVQHVFFAPLSMVSMSNPECRRIVPGIVFNVEAVILTTSCVRHGDLQCLGGKRGSLVGKRLESVRHDLIWISE